MGRVSPFSVLTVSKCGNFDAFLALKFDSLIRKTTFYFIVRVLKNAFFHAPCLLRLYYTAIRPFLTQQHAASSNQKGRIRDSCSWMEMTVILCKIRLENTHNCRSLIKVKFSTDQFRPALESCLSYHDDKDNSVIKSKISS